MRIKHWFAQLKNILLPESLLSFSRSAACCYAAGLLRKGTKSSVSCSFTAFVFVALIAHAQR